MKTPKMIVVMCVAMATATGLVTTARGDTAAVANSAATYRMYDKQRHRAMKEEQDNKKKIIEEAKNAPEYKDAMKAVRDAHAAYETKREDTIAKLRKENQEFAGLADSIDAVDAQIEKMRDEGGSPEGFQALYKQKTDLKKKAKKVGMETFVADGGADLYKKWRDTSAYLQDMNINIEMQAGNDESVKAAQAKAKQLREQMDVTLVELTTAKAQLREERRDEYWGGGGYYRYND